MTAAGTVLERLHSEANEREKRKADQYRQLIVDVANGTSTPDEASAILAATGHTAAELDRDVRVCLSRAALRDKMAAGVAAEADLLVTNQAIDAVDQEYRDFVAQNASKRRPLEFKIRELQNVLSEAQSAKADLQRTCPDHELNGRAAGVLRDITRLTEQRKQAQRELESAQSTLGIAKSKLSPKQQQEWFGGDDKPEGMPQEVALAQQRVERHQAAVDSLTVEINKLIAESDALTKQKMER